MGTERDTRKRRREKKEKLICLFFYYFLKVCRHSVRYGPTHWHDRDWRRRPEWWQQHQRGQTVIGDNGYVNFHFQLYYFILLFFIRHYQRDNIIKRTALLVSRRKIMKNGRVLAFPIRNVLLSILFCLFYASASTLLLPLSTATCFCVLFCCCCCFNICLSYTHWAPLYVV